MENNIKYLVEACDALDLEYEFIDVDQNFVRVRLDSGWQYFELNKTPFNSEVAYCICKDKSHTYQLLKDTIKMPKTLDFLDFKVDKKYLQYKHYNSVASALHRIEDNLTYPLVVKCNKGALGVNVFMCEDDIQTEKAFNEIFDHQSRTYDYIALTQEFIVSKAEYRLLCVYGEPIFAYRRGHTSASFNAKYWEKGEHADLVTDNALFKRLAEFVAPVHGQLSMGLVGYDIILDEHDELYLIELNASPQFNNFVKHNSAEPVIDLYKKGLSELNKR